MKIFLNFCKIPLAIANISNREYREFDDDVVFYLKLKDLKLNLKMRCLKENLIESLKINI